MFVSLTETVAFIEGFLGKGRLSRDSLNIELVCPYCDPIDKTKRKLVIRTDRLCFHCWTCDRKGRSLIPLLRRFGSVDDLEEYRKKFGGSGLTASVDDLSHVALPDGFKLLATAPSNPDFDAVKNYVLSRGLTEHDLWLYKIGASDDIRFKRRAIVPSFDANGKLNYYVARAIDARRRPKYDNPQNDKMSVIFNEINVDWSKRLVLCEGVFDSFKCGDNVVPMLGSVLNEESALFNAILINSTPVALAMDSDMRSTKTISVARMLAEYNIDTLVVELGRFGDPGEMTRGQFKDALDGARPLDWHDTMLTKLSNALHVSMSI